MRFGLGVNNQWAAGEDMGRLIREAEEQVRLAREAGFDLILAGQHYLSYPYQMPTSFPFLARMSVWAEGMRVLAIVVLPLHQPVDVAESIATLDAMTGGRAVLAVVQGYRNEEFNAFGTSMKERMPRTLEALDVIKKLLTQDEVEHHGRFYTLPRMKIATRPVQKPHPPIWIGANNDVAIVRAAGLGHEWFVNPHATFPVLERQVGLFREELKRVGKSVGGLPIIRELYVAKDRATAFAAARPHLEPKYKSYSVWGQDRALPGQESFMTPFEHLSRDRFLIGSPEDIVAEAGRYEEQLGIDTMVFRLQWSGMPHRQALEEIELMGKEVIPHFAKAEASRRRMRSNAQKAVAPQIAP